jgi:hypothetical protein
MWRDYMFAMATILQIPVIIVDSPRYDREVGVGCCIRGFCGGLFIFLDRASKLE